MNKVFIQVESVSNTGYIVTLNPGSPNCNKEVVMDDNNLATRLGNIINAGLVIKANKDAVQIAAVSRPVPKEDKVLSPEEKDSISVKMEYICQQSPLIGFENKDGIVYYGDQADYVGRILDVIPDKIQTKNGMVSRLFITKHPEVLKRLSIIPNINNNIRRYDEESLRKQVTAREDIIKSNIEAIQKEEIEAANRKSDEENKKKQKKGKK